MKRASFFLALNDNRWHVTRIQGQTVEVRDVDVPAERGPAEPDIISQISAILKEWGYRGQGVCLGLPSLWVYAARIDCAGLPRRNRYSIMLYRLEEQLPLDAETLTADFLPGVGGTCLGLAVKTQSVRSVVDALSAAGVEVFVICPTALLALREFIATCTETVDFTVIGDSPSPIDIFRIADGVPVTWHTISDGGATLLQTLSVDLLERPNPDGTLKVGLLGAFAQDTEESLRGQHPGCQVIRGEESPIHAASGTASRALTDESAGWVNFRRADLSLPDAWQRCAGLVRVACVLMVALLVALPALMCRQVIRYDEITSQCREKQRTEYHRLYPNRPLPADAAIRSRLESDLVRLAGTSGSGFATPERVSALETLKRITAGLPPATRIQITEARITPSGIMIEGQAREHADAQIIAKALARGGFIIDPPRTETLPGKGVSFTIAGVSSPPQPSPQPTSEGRTP